MTLCNFRQDATFYYLNVAPQWKKFNAGNWLQVELQTRWYAQRTNKDLEIYTGTYKVLRPRPLKLSTFDFKATLFSTNPVINMLIDKTRKVYFLIAHVYLPTTQQF